MLRLNSDLYARLGFTKNTYNIHKLPTIHLLFWPRCWSSPHQLSICRKNKGNYILWTCYYMYEGTERKTESTSDELATGTISEILKKEYHFSNKTTYSRWHCWVLTDDCTTLLIPLKWRRFTLEDFENKIQLQLLIKKKDSAVQIKHL